MGQTDILLWTLISMRVSGFVLVNPIFGRRGIPNLVKAGLIMGLSIFLFTMPHQETIEVGSLLEYVVLLLKEFVLGYLIGFIVSLFQYIIVLAGGIIDFQMGLSMATIYDMQSNSSIALSATILNIMFMLIFFVMDGHHALFQLLIDLRKIVPYGTLSLSADASAHILKLFAECTLLGVQLAFPVIALELVGEAGVGILMKTIPQINIFAVNIQTKILIGLIAIVFLIAPMGDFIKELVLNMVEQLQTVVSLM
ncbi:MAG: flagellar biosynthetic protein FliR [Peptostreptococcaceae bacterium]|nr:flagellar biosynthetic protein FliR [Peptostreptococcaceae bacterium]